MKTTYSFTEKVTNGFLSLFGIRDRSANKSQKLVYEGYISGYQYHKGQQLEHLFNQDTYFSLKHEPENPFDEDAVAIYYQDARIGFIPPNNNVEIARMIREGQELRARMAKFEPHSDPWERVYVEIVNESRDNMSVC
jgi:hypothetical protein